MSTESSTTKGGASVIPTSPSRKSMEGKLGELQALNAKMTSVNEKLAMELKRRDESLRQMKDERKMMMKQNSSSASTEEVQCELKKQADTISGLESEIVKLQGRHKQTCRVLVERMDVEMGKRDSMIKSSISPRSPVGCFFPDAPSQSYCTDLINFFVGGKKSEDFSLDGVLERLSSPTSSLSPSNDKRLDFSRQDIGDEEVFELVTGILMSRRSRVEQISFDDDSIGPPGAARLSELLQSKKCLVELLSLKRNRIGDVGTGRIAAALELNCTLTDLDLSSNGVGVTGATMLCVGMRQNQTLEKLSLRSNQLRDLGLVKLSKCIGGSSCSLLSLDVSRNDVGLVGISALCEAIVSQNSRLTSLNCGDNPKIGERGGLAIASALSDSRCELAKLFVRNIDCGDRVGVEFGKSLQSSNIVEIDLANNNIESNGGLALSEALTSRNANSSLRRLRLDNNFRLGIDAVIALCKAPRLYELSFRNVPLGVQSWALVDVVNTYVSDNLQTLDLRGAQVDDDTKRDLQSARDKRNLLLTIYC